jgi:biopolymer transport protein TolQ
MNALNVLAVSATGTPTRLDPLRLFLDADIVVQIVIVGLVVASIWVWTIIIGFSIRMARVRRQSAAYEDAFWKTADLDEFQRERAGHDIALARVVDAGLGEWRRSTATERIDREGTRQRLAQAMDVAVTEQIERLAERLNFLATVGAVAPFVGLFGTVWGIMSSFFDIGVQRNTSLAVVAPGISEALFATAMGLFAAIPAVIAYNRFSHRVNALEARFLRFTDRFHATLSRELEIEG